MKVLFICTAHNSLSQRLSLELQARNHSITVEMALSPEAMLKAAELAQPDLIICPFLTKRVPQSVYTRWLTLIVHPGPLGDAGPSSIDLALFGDTGDLEKWDEQLALINFRQSKGAAPSRRSHWGVTVLQAIEALDAGPVVAWEQFELDAEVSAMTKSDLYRGPVTNAALVAVLAALERLTLAFPTQQPLPVELPSSLTELSRTSVLLKSPFLGGPTHERPLLKATARDWLLIDAPSPEVIVQRINSADSQPGVQSSLLASTPLFLYGAFIQNGPIPVDVAARATTSKTGSVLAVRDGAILVNCGSSKPIWITHLRKPKARSDPYLHPKLPALQAIESIPGLAEKLDLDSAPEWLAESDTTAANPWARKQGTWQQVWVDVEQVGEASKVAYVSFDFYNGAASTQQCVQLCAALDWALAVPGLAAIVLMGGAGYFSNGIHLNVIEGSADPAAESWANINAIDDVVQRILSPGVLTIAAVRGNAAAGGLALATACDVVLCSMGASLNPAYRGLGLHGSEYHMWSYTARTGSKVARKLTHSMLPMSPAQAQQCGLIDHIVGTGSDGPAAMEALMKRNVEQLVNARVKDAGSWSLLGCGASWTKPVSSFGFERILKSEEPLINSMLDNKHANLALLFATRAGRNAAVPSFAEGFASFRKAELEQMRLDFFHPVRSQRYHSRRLAFVRKLVPSSTPTRFALHHRFGADWAHAQESSEAVLDPEEEDAFDGLGDVADSEAIVRMPVPVVRVQNSMARSESQISALSQASSVSASTCVTTPSTSAPPSPPNGNKLAKFATSDVLEERERQEARAAAAQKLEIGSALSTPRCSSPAISFDSNVTASRTTPRGSRRLSASNLAAPFSRFSPTLNHSRSSEAVEHLASATAPAPKSKVSRMFASLSRSSTKSNGSSRATVAPPNEVSSRKSMSAISQSQQQQHARKQSVASLKHVKPAKPGTRSRGSSISSFATALAPTDYSAAEKVDASKAAPTMLYPCYYEADQTPRAV